VIDVNTLAEYREYSMKGSMLQYGKNKLYLTSFFNELVRRCTGISFYALCPGPVNSNIARDAPKILHPIMKLFFLIFFRSPKKAAEPILYFACKPGIENKSGTYIHLMEEKPVSPEASDPEKGRELWDRSAELLTDYLPK